MPTTSPIFSELITPVNPFEHLDDVLNLSDEDAMETTSAAVADVNGDGLLDILIGNTE